MKREQQANSLDRPDRRTVLAGSLAATAAAPRAWSARPRRPGVRPVYVQVFLRGGMDGLTAVVPYADGELYSWRPTLAIRPPGFPNGALDIDGFFGFAPCTARLQTPFAAGHMAIVHAAGSSDPTRSHFDSFQRIEFGDANLPLGLVHDGWVARYLAATAASARGPLRAIAMHDFLPYSLTGARNALPIPDVRTFALPGRLDTAALRVAVLEETFGRRRQLVR